MNHGRGVKILTGGIRAWGAVFVLLSGYLLLPGIFGLSGTRAAHEQDPVARYLRSFDEVELSTYAVARQVRMTGEILLQTGDLVFDVVLEPHDMRAPGYRAEEVAEGGVIRSVDPGPVRTYRGRAPGFAESEARFSITEDMLEGVILTPDEWYYVEPRRNFTPGADPARFVIYRRSDILPEAFGTCATSLAERIGEGREFLEPLALPADGATYVAEVATEADYEYVTALGGSSAADSAILDIMNQVDGIYQTQLSVVLQVVYQHTWASAGDPYASTAPSTMLSEFRNHWNSNFYSLSYDLAHMWTGKDMDGSTIGIAYLSVVCNARSYSYGISQRFSASPGKYILTAHEIGHNFGATHTESADPPQTDCNNTIMNSSIGTGTDFCPYSRNEVSAHVAAYSSCLASGPTAPSNLTATAVSGSQINLTWRDNSADETGFRIDRKIGAGGTWSLAATTGANVEALSDRELAAGTTYYYRVQAVSGSGSSAYSSEAWATTLSAAPTITGLNPSSGNPGTVVTITGTNLSEASSVRFNVTTASEFTVNSPSQIVATVPAGATTGRVSVTTPAGSATSASNFVVLSCSFSLSPTSGSWSVAGGNGSFVVTTAPGCSWTAASGSGWLTVTSGGSGIGNGEVRYAVAFNGSGNYRTASIAAGGQSFGVSQSGVVCDLNIDSAVNALDIQALVNAVLGIGAVPTYYDLNQDGGVNALDLQRLANVVLGISSCP